MTLCHLINRLKFKLKNITIYLKESPEIPLISDDAMLSLLDDASTISTDADDDDSPDDDDDDDEDSSDSDSDDSTEREEKTVTLLNKPRPK